MKKISIAFILLFVIGKTASAQKATLHISIAHSSATSCHLWLPDMALFNDYLKKGIYDPQLSAAGMASQVFKITKPQFIYMMYFSSDGNDATRSAYILYLSPGDDLTFKADFNSTDNGVVVTGKGSRNNQPLLAGITAGDVEYMYGDTLPNRIIAFANTHQAALRKALPEYVKRYKPSADFIKNEQFNIEYDAAETYYDFKGSNKFMAREGYARNEAEWKAIQDSLFATVKINNEDAVTALNYFMLIKDFMLREKESEWTRSYQQPQAFYKEWYNTDEKTGQLEFHDDMANLFQEKIISKYFTGKPAEFLYAVLFDDALSEHNPKNIVAIFDGFKQKYPQSKYIGWFGPTIDTIRMKETQPLTSDMIIAPGNGTNLNTFDDLLQLTKGKTVLLDMWGTWCGPCRNEIHDNGPAIKAYFKGKGLDYFYVANRDLENEAEWKKLIAYFDMKGTHILANTSLTKDIMTKVKGPGYPTYVIIKKDGTYELSKAGYPMNRDVLIKQLEAALAQPNP